jgi:2-keto-3-deoxy-L-rhamnonate aldolase RhmA
MKFLQIPTLQEREQEREGIKKARFPPEMLRNSRI